MKFDKKLPLYFVIALLFCFKGQAQENSGVFKKSIQDADILYAEGNQLRALIIYDSLLDLNPSNNYLQYRTGICLTYKSEGRDRAFQLLKKLENDANYPDVLFWLGRAKHLDYQFQEAITLYNKYLKISSPSGSQRIQTLKYIDNCKSGAELMTRKMALSLELLSPPSNNENSQYSPVISPDGKYLYYTNRGPSSKGDLMDKSSRKNPLGNYYEDIFVAELIGNSDFEFGEGKNLSDNINKANEHEAPLSISYDGKVLFIYLSGNKQSEDIFYSSRIDQNTWSKPKEVIGINTEYWEGHAFLAPDGRTLFFSSDRPGGYGGRDIYKATMQADSSFSDIINLGPKINTQFNEDGPFIDSKGSALYFSSEAHGSIGGYDMFYIKYDSARLNWEEAINLGYPINTTDDDRFYYITPDGEYGFFSSARASGENLHDIYKIRPGSFEKLNSLVLLVGKIFIDEKPASAIIKINEDKTGRVLADLTSEENSGEFLYSLIPGRKYKITILSDGLEPRIEHIEVPAKQQGVLRFEHRFDIYSPSFLEVKKAKEIELQSDLDNQISNNTEVFKGHNYKKLDVLKIELGRDELTDSEFDAGFRFRVQVGAYRNPGKFNYSFLRAVGAVEILSCEDGITRYLMGQKFKTRAEAEVLRQKCIDAGEWDAWITVGSTEN